MSHEPSRNRKPALALLAIGGLCTLGAALGGIYRPGAFFYSYLFGFLLWGAVPLGCAAILMLHVLTGGRWGKSVGPISQVAVRTLPVLILGFIPLIFGLTRLYHWARPEAVAQSPALQLKHAYLNVPFFLGRAALFLILWALGGWLLGRWSKEPSARLSRLSAAGLVVYVLTASFAAIDWVGSLEAEWYSTVFGLYVVVGQALSGLAVAVGAYLWLTKDREPSLQVRNDLGTLLLTLVVLHAYLAFSQFFLIWIGNLPKEIAWYLPRMRGPWTLLSLALILLHFALPFMALLFRVIKRQRTTLLLVVGLILLGRVLDSAWMVLPSFGPPSGVLLGLSAACGLGLGGLWLGLWAFLVPKAGLYPEGSES